MTKHSTFSELDSVVYLTIVKEAEDWKLAAMSRNALMCFATENTGLDRVDGFDLSLRHFQEDENRLSYLHLKSGSKESPSPRTIWKGRETDFSAATLHRFLSIEVDPYEFEQVFLADADFPFSEFAALAQLRCETQWDFSLLVPGPMDGILYRIPISLISARPSDRKQVSSEGRIVVSWADLSGHESMQDFLDGLLPALDGWNSVPTFEEKTPAPPPEVRPELSDRSDQETSH